MPSFKPNLNANSLKMAKAKGMNSSIMSGTINSAGNNTSRAIRNDINEDLEKELYAQMERASSPEKHLGGGTLNSTDHMGTEHYKKINIDTSNGKKLQTILNAFRTSQ